MVFVNDSELVSDLANEDILCVAFDRVKEFDSERVNERIL